MTPTSPPRSPKSQSMLKKAHQIIQDLDDLQEASTPVRLAAYGKVMQECARALADMESWGSDPYGVRPGWEDHARKLILYCTTKATRLVRTTSAIPVGPAVEIVELPKDPLDTDLEASWQEYERG